MTPPTALVFLIDDDASVRKAAVTQLSDETVLAEIARVLKGSPSEEELAHFLSVQGAA